ncbi:MAG: hypothetical protein BWZ10_01224 [candidate division BRC1 bacterium ADurb.BinA364]|nr:MAG: hypothetical protein BWZ10_01224 [candidate division BRC1 bacterium ADurb.BinA364]
MGGARFESLQFDQTQCLGDPAPRFGAGNAARLQSEGDIALDAQVGKQCVVLKHHRRVAEVGRNSVHAAAVEKNISLGRIVESGDDAQRRRLAAARSAQQRKELAALDTQRYALQRDGLFESLADPGQADFVHLPGSLISLRQRSIHGPTLLLNASQSIRIGLHSTARCHAGWASGGRSLRALKR